MKKGFNFLKFIQIGGWGDFSHKKGGFAKIGGCFKKGGITYYIN